MSGPVRIQLRRTKGWRMPENTVVASRPGPLGNPWTIAEAREAGYADDERALAAWCVDLFREWLRGSPGSITALLPDSIDRRARLISHLPDLRGKNLACWCAPDMPCHADVLLELANRG